MESSDGNEQTDDTAIASAPPTTVPDTAPDGGAKTPQQRYAEMADAANTDILKKYSADWMAGPERWRARANLALTLSSSIAALIGFGTLIGGLSDDFDAETILTRSAIGVALVIWVLAALAALRAVALDVDDSKARAAFAKVKTVPQLLDVIQQWADIETDQLRRRVELATRLMGLALVVTLGTVALAAYTSEPEPAPGPGQRAEIIFTADAEVELEQVCDREFSPVPVVVPDGTDLNADRITIEIEECDGRTRPLTIAWEFVKALVFFQTSDS